MEKEVKIYKALADKTRLRILKLIFLHKELCTCHLVEMLELPQSTVSRHIALLRNVDLLSSKRVGSFNYYSITKEESFPLRENILSALSEIPIEDKYNKDVSKIVLKN